MPRIEAAADNRSSALRASPVCIAVATFVAIVCICTAIFFATARLVFDADHHLTGGPLSALGAWALVLIMIIFVLPLCLLVLAACMDQCPVWWMGLLTLCCSIPATFAIILFPVLRRFVPIGLIAQGSNSSDRWYLGAMVQLVIALFLLRFFRKPKPV